VQAPLIVLFPLLATWIVANLRSQSLRWRELVVCGLFGFLLAQATPIAAPLLTALNGVTSGAAAAFTSLAG